MPSRWRRWFWASTHSSIGYQRWVATFADPQHAHNFPKTDNQSWYGLLYRHLDALDGKLLLLWFAGSLAVGVLWLWYWRRTVREAPSREQWWRMELSLMPFILWTAPLSWIHHQILLWPLLALAWQMGRHDRASRVVFVISLILLTVLSQSIIGRAATLEVLRLGLPLVAFVLLDVVGERPGSYSPLSTAIGSRRVARTAGTAMARSATTLIITTAPR